ncbi:MAG: TIGR01620 family protein [Rhodobacterales bacterium]|nr:MAG: TIGR01620 family protein [Rhodobacterales bacterium]
MSERRNAPVLIEVDEAPESPAAAPPVPEVESAPQPRAMQAAFALAGRRSSRLGRWFLGLSLSFLTFWASLAAWNYVTGLLAANPVLGMVAAGLLAAILITLLILAARELAGFARLRRVDRVQHAAGEALSGGEREAALAVNRSLKRLYGHVDALKWGLRNLSEREADLLDADALLQLAESELMAPLDAAARREIEAAARQVATVTALVPLALMDVVTALTANLRMIRRIAEIYGGRAGVAGTWRLTRAVMAHLVATGAVAVGDDLIGSLAGGGMLSKLSRRFGEGVVNGALTARVGVAAIEVCRPLPFIRAPRPRVSGLIKRALTGVFDA